MINRLLNFYKRKFWSAERYVRFRGVKIGKGCFISTKNFSSEPYLIEIGDYCRIASNVSILMGGYGLKGKNMKV